MVFQYWFVLVDGSWSWTALSLRRVCFSVKFSPSHVADHKEMEIEQTADVQKE
jgi:hypothetical protein